MIVFHNCTIRGMASQFGVWVQGGILPTAVLALCALSG